MPKRVDLSEGGDHDAQKRYIELETQPLILIISIKLFIEIESK